MSAPTLSACVRAMDICIGSVPVLGDQAGMFVTVDIKSALADVLEASEALRRDQSCDGTAHIQVMRFDMDGNEAGWDYEQCGGCCACGREAFDAATAVLLAVLTEGRT